MYSESFGLQVSYVTKHFINDPTQNIKKKRTRLVDFKYTYFNADFNGDADFSE